MSKSLAKDLAAAARKILNDEVASIYRWSDAELLGYLDAGIAQAVALKPSLFLVTETVALVAGAEQTLPVGGVVFDAVVSDTAGNAPREVTVAALDSLVPGWQSAAAGAFMIFAAKSPVNGFYFTYPQQIAAGAAKVRFAKIPAASTIIGVDSAVANSQVHTDKRFDDGLVSFIVYKGLDKETIEGNRTKGDGYFKKYLAVFSEAQT